MSTIYVVIRWGDPDRSVHLLDAHSTNEKAEVASAWASAKWGGRYDIVPVDFDRLPGMQA